MYHEDLARLTADHLRAHIGAYLTAENARHTEKVKLIVPKSIEPASVVGGMFTEFNNILPQYGIDVLDKVFMPDNSGDLFTYLYSGQINGLVHGSTQDSVDKLIKRHSAGVEFFIRNHLTLHESSQTPLSANFALLEFSYLQTQFSGAEDLGEVEGSHTWMAAFSIDCAWLTSEDGPGLHA